MTRTLVYSKHTPLDHCGVAFFAGALARRLPARHVHDFHGFSACDEFFINMDILELREDEVTSILSFLESGSVGRSVLLMHDYRFSYLEDRLVAACDLIVNLSGEPALTRMARDKVLELFTPSLTEPPALQLVKTRQRPTSLAFGFFSPRKKSFNLYLAFYEHMLAQHPDWFHIIVTSAHTGDTSADSQLIKRLLESESVLILDFLPNTLLSELIHVADLGVCFYPTGLMINNTTPLSFFSQARSVVTNFGALTPIEYTSFTLDGTHLNGVDFGDLPHLKAVGDRARNYHEKHLTWEHFLARLRASLAEREASDGTDVGGVRT